MALRNVVRIDEDLCNGCGECVPSCAEGAIRIVDGKARLVADNLCDGLGACLGDCPEGAISMEVREADNYDEKAVDKHLKRQGGGDMSEHSSHQHHNKEHDGPDLACGCPGAKVIQFAPQDGKDHATGRHEHAHPMPSRLAQWPIQLHLVPPTAPYYQNADLLLAADCTAFAIGDFHQKHMNGKAIAIACPKLDHGMEIYLKKLIAMIDEANINTITVMVMEVPCCSGLVQLAKEAASMAKRKVPVKYVNVGLRGDILAEEWV